MWLMTTTGFVSIVQKHEDRDRGTLTVRARDAYSLKAFAEAAGRIDAEYKMDMATDYPFRDVFTREEVVAALLVYVETLRYSNFKNAAKRLRGEKYAKALGNVWWEMQSMTSRKVKRAMNRAWVSALPSGSRWSSGGAWSDETLALTHDAYVVPPADADPTDEDLAALEGKGVMEMTDAEWEKYMIDNYGDDSVNVHGFNEDH